MYLYYFNIFKAPSYTHHRNSYFTPSSNNFKHIYKVSPSPILPTVDLIIRYDLAIIDDNICWICCIQTKYGPPSPVSYLKILHYITVQPPHIFPHNTFDNSIPLLKFTLKKVLKEPNPKEKTQCIYIISIYI